MLGTMKVLFDFDGVLTTQIDEALRVRDLFERKIAAHLRQPLDHVRMETKRIDAAMEKEPYRHGWTFHERISAFMEEDLFIHNNAIAHYLDQGRGSVFHTLVVEAYDEMVQETLKSQHKPLEEEAKQLLSELVAHQVEVVIVSNSGTTRIQDILHSAGLGEGIHVRGGARKFALGNTPRHFSISQYQIEVDRPTYRNILLEEKPHYVVGDVFSLDLALPYHLAEFEGAFPHPVNLCLRLQPYTPEWSKKFVTEFTRTPRTNFRGISSLSEIAFSIFSP